MIAVLKEEGRVYMKWQVGYIHVSESQYADYDKIERNVDFSSSIPCPPSLSSTFRDFIVWYLHKHSLLSDDGCHKSDLLLA